VTGPVEGFDAPARSPRPAAELEDRLLLQAHLNGDPAAFTELVRRHRDRLWAVAMRTLGDREEASDALQDAFISAFRNAASYRGEAAVTTWLHRVVVNACLDRLRRRKARPSVPLGDTEVSSTRDDEAAVEARLMIHTALGQLPDGQRMAIVLVDLQEYSVAEAAAALGVPEGTVKSRCSRGRLELARLLGAHLPAPGAARTGEPGPRGRAPAATGGNRSGPPRVAEPEARALGTPDQTTSGGGR